jgi:DNA-binding transcriptional ArsR family regulator
MDATFNADHVFAALADATRRDIVLRALGGNEGVAELAGHYPMSFAAVQKHVAVLERAGLVTKERTAVGSCARIARGAWRDAARPVRGPLAAASIG